MKKVAFVGSGEYAGALYTILKASKSDLAAVFDNDSEKIGQTRFGLVVQSARCLNHHDFDVVVISAGEWVPIYRQLLETGCPTRKIAVHNLWVFDMEILEKLSLSQNPEVLITGISYAAPIRFGEIPYCNLAFQSQDVFFDACLARIFIEKNPKVRAVVLTLHQYALEYDLLLSKQRYLGAKYLDIPNFMTVAGDVSARDAALLEQTARSVEATSFDREGNRRA
jgi:hypothetical protein